jgi:hypothetical protein
MAPKISHTTIISAPIDQIWKALIDIDDWKWNKWTRLEASQAKTGVTGKLKGCYEGNDQDWETFNFFFGEISQENHLLTWKGKVAGGVLFSGHHTMELEKIDDQTTRLIHEERFGGLLPMLNLGLPYKTLDRNYLLMNKALKAHVEGMTQEAQ